LYGAKFRSASYKGAGLKVVGKEPHPKRDEEESTSREDWRARNAFIYLLVVGSLAAFSVFYWRLHFELLHSVEAGVMAIPTVVLLLLPFIWTSKYVEYKGYDSRSAATLTGLAITPFLIFLFIVLYVLNSPLWVCFIAPAIVGLALSAMYKSAKRTRLSKNSDPVRS
jgi:hypothetical protein